MRTTTISAAEMRIDARLKRLADEEHWNITTQLLDRIIRESGRAADQPRPVDIEQPGKSAAARATRLAALERETTPTTVATGECHLGSCTDSPTGWRLYVHEGWQPVCTRHMGAAKSLARVFNRELEAGAATMAPEPAVPVPVLVVEITPQVPTEVDLPMGVLRLVAKGLTNQQIADELGVGFEQAQYQLRLWTRASRTSSRDALAAWVDRTGILGGSVAR